MSGSHGDLFIEIGKLVLAAHSGQSFDLTAKSAELAHRYANLGMPAETIAKAIARSLGAVGISMALVPHADGGFARQNGLGRVVPMNADAVKPNGAEEPAEMPSAAPDRVQGPTKSAAALFPSGVRLAVLS